jgi:hypothetical protein
MLLFQRDAVMLGIGCRDLPNAFGLELSVAAHSLDYLRLNCGGENGQSLPAGQRVESPRMYLWLDHHADLWRSVDHYTGLLREDGVIARNSSRNVPHWWLRPIYCTWNDQNYLAGLPAFYNWPGEGFVGKSGVDAFDERMLDHLLDVLEREQYPVGSVILDDGWQTCRGEWRADPKKFPNLRRQIDQIHAMGLKAILWVAPFDVAPEAPVRHHPEWLAGNGVLGKWQMPLVDYSSPRTQQEYVEPLLRYWFSSDAGCLDADGIKVDFMADKIHPIFPIHNPTWRGEEPFIFHTLSLWNRLMKSHKPDAMLLGCTAHPHFNACQDLIRTYDVPDSQLQHADRCVMLRHFNPGTLISLDMSETRSMADVRQHLQIARDHGTLFELGRIAPDPATGEFVFGREYVELMKRALSAWGPLP